mgnify:CR=1 FL=1
MEQYLRKTAILFVLNVYILVCLNLWVEASRELAGKFTVEQMVDYKSLPSYSQAPVLEKFEQKGEIPPISQRLPSEPFIWKSNVMADGPGVYGDVMRRVYGAGTEGWNFAVGQIQGWGGTEAYRESLVNISMMWMMKEPEPIPNLARSWEWTDDGHTLIMKLVKGHIGLMGTSSRLRMLFFPTTTFWMIKSLVGKPKVLFHLGIKSRNSNR